MGPCARRKLPFDPAPVVSVSCMKAFDSFPLPRPFSLTCSQLHMGDSGSGVKSGFSSQLCHFPAASCATETSDFTSLSLSFSVCELGVRTVQFEEIVVINEGDNGQSRHPRLLSSSCCLISSSITQSMDPAFQICWHILIHLKHLQACTYSVPIIVPAPVYLTKPFLCPTFCSK